MIERPTIDAREAITHLQEMQNQFDVPEEEDARELFLEEMDSEDYGRYQAYGNALDVIYLLAKGVTPEQGKPDNPETYRDEDQAFI